MSRLYFPVVNSDTISAPPFALMKITGINSDGLMTVSRPTADSDPDVVLGGSAPIPAGAKGQAHLTFPAVAAYQPDVDNEDPAALEEWGARAGSWYLHKGKTGFLVCGGSYAGNTNVVKKTATGGSGGGIDLQGLSSAGTSLDLSDVENLEFDYQSGFRLDGSSSQATLTISTVCADWTVDVDDFRTTRWGLTKHTSGGIVTLDGNGSVNDPDAGVPSPLWYSLSQYLGLGTPITAGLRILFYGNATYNGLYEVTNAGEPNPDDWDYTSPATVDGTFTLISASSCRVFIVEQTSPAGPYPSLWVNAFGTTMYRVGIPSYPDDPTPTGAWNTSDVTPLGRYSGSTLTKSFQKELSRGWSLPAGWMPNLYTIPDGGGLTSGSYTPSLSAPATHLIMKPASGASCTLAGITGDAAGGIMTVVCETSLSGSGNVILKGTDWNSPADVTLGPSMAADLLITAYESGSPVSHNQLLRYKA